MAEELPPPVAVGATPVAAVFIIYVLSAAFCIMYHTIGNFVEMEDNGLKKAGDVV